MKSGSIVCFFFFFPSGRWCCILNYIHMDFYSWVFKENGLEVSVNHSLWLCPSLSSLQLHCLLLYLYTQPKQGKIN